MQGILSRRLASITGAALLIVGLLPGPGLLAASVASAVGPATHLVLTQQPSNTTVGVAISPAVTVTIEDSSGTTVDTSSTVAIAIGSGSPSGGLHGSVSNTAVHGVATFSNLSIDTVGTGFTLTATDAADGPLTVTSDLFNVTAVAVVDHIAFGSLPAPTPVGATLSPVTVLLQDSGGNTVTTATGSATVVIWSGPAGAQLLGNHTATVVNGVATFSGLSIDTAGSYTLYATYGALHVTSATITITTTNHLAFWTQPVGGAAGAVWPNFQVAVEYPTTNAVVSGDNSTVVSIVIATNPAGGTLSCTGGMSETVVSGYATFTGCSINVASASYYTLYATSSPVWTPITSGAFYIGGSANHLAFTTQPGGGAAGAVWAQQPVVAVENASNAVISDYTTVVYLSIATNPAGGTISCTGGLSEVAVNGYATFTGCSINVASASYYTLYATSSPSWTAATSGGFYIGGSSQQLAFVTQPGGGAAGAVWTQQPVVAVENASNAVVTTDNSTVVYLSIATNPAGGTLSCTGGTSEVAVGGYAYFTGCSINLASASYYTLTATSSPAWTPATSSAFYVSGAQTTPTLTASSALGASATSGFSTPTKIIKVGQSITIRVTSNPQLAGARLGVWIAVKGSNGTWGAYKPHASVTMDSTGTVYYTYKIGSKAWLAFRLYYGGSTTYAPAWSYPSQFGRAM